MSTLKVTTKTSTQITSAFADVFKNVKGTPAEKPVTQEDRLAPYAKEIMKLRRRGVSWRNIAAGMADPRIAEKVSDKLLKKIFGVAEKPASSQPAPPSDGMEDRLVLDPLTGQEVTPRSS